ncbi:ATP-binding cassette domain-containing protein [Bacillus cereus]|uniref:ABC transporter ATP-binding protein n=1 Tax=Bacillus thuringiensis TaxID=1428 RepID=UPI000676CC37|nr:ATP-binding cassette domain-containing protein [Bacillus thuringiensis]MEB8874797.1 ATP-binding cassette domain-containing protein [Bacillus cereus]AKR38863.1 ATP-binding transport protein NatA [Bacillus thuringiensis serovar indiana]MBG9643184.1 hypothetical protein [Bacillus thuringiensis]MBG9649277.1 hypothetical protein [Bacillus thuringiensis]MEB9620166.1 ATP-binding cassette domain-containing protein [Bacillus cereus]
MSFIEVKDLVREFRIPKKGENFFQSMFSRGGTVKRVVDHLNFSIEKGEFVAYLGPNGAGKSTTIKMLSGVLVPTSGTVTVNGIEPYKKRKHYSRNIGVVFGQRSQLWWDLPLIDSFKLLAKIYNLPKNQFESKLEVFTEILDMKSFLYTHVRKLSLGQRMRGDIAAALLHDPEILFLDEPTIGLDIIAKEKIYSFLKRMNQEMKITVLLTTHYMDDVETLCDRVIFIDDGKVVFDGSKEQLTKLFGENKHIVVKTNENASIPLLNKGWLYKVVENEIWIPINHDTQIPSLLQEISEIVPVHSLNIREPKIEDIVKKIYVRKKESVISTEGKVHV